MAAHCYRCEGSRILKYICITCCGAIADENIQLMHNEWDEESSRHRSSMDSMDRALVKFQSRLAFLRLPFDSGLAEGIPLKDVTILVQDDDDKPLHAHRIVLASRSSVFSKMFQTEMVESRTGIVRIGDSTFPVIRAMIQFCYSSEIDFNQEVPAEDVMVVAHKYSIGLLQDICEEHLLGAINNANSIKLLTMATKFDAKRLQKSALTYFKDNFDDAIVPFLEELRQ